MNFVYLITKSTVDAVEVHTESGMSIVRQWSIDDIIDCFTVGNKLSLLEFKKFTKDIKSLKENHILNNSDIQSLRNHGITIVYFYPDSLHYIVDIDHDSCKLIKSVIRDKKINSVINE